MKKQPIRIAQIIGKWVGGGVEAVVMNYYRHIDRNKIQFDFICDEDSTNIPYDEIESLGGKVIIIPPYQKVFKYHKELKRVLKEGNYKIVHSHINTLSVFSLCAAKAAGVPVRIAHSHSTTSKKEIRRNIIKGILRHLSRLYPTVCCACSEKAAEFQFGKKYYQDGKVIIIKNAIDINLFEYNKKSENEIRSSLGIDEKTLVIGHIGRFCTVKNHTFILDIYNEIHKENKNSILLLAGDGPLFNEVKKKISLLKLDSNVKCLGYRNDVDNLYQAFNCFLLPSLYEGLPVVGIEAQASCNLCFFSTEITREIGILKSTQFISLRTSAKEWAKIIVNKAKNFKKSSTYEAISDAGYNIRIESKKLQKLYFSLYTDIV